MDQPMSQAAVWLMAGAIPLFFVAIALELWFSRRKHVEVYVFADSITSLSCGVLQQIAGVWLKAVGILAYEWCFRNALFRLDWPAGLSAQVVVFIAVFVAVDHQYYWFHRLSHRVGFLWAAHAVHHQSEEYNLTTALRQSAVQMLFSSVFYLPVALAGVPTGLFVLVLTLQTLYQFWIHTRLIDKLAPWFEAVFNTPSHHRVHHGINAEYIDKNHAGVLIVWDRIFGTFTPERAEPVYGTVKPIADWNPLYGNLMPWLELSQKSRQAKGWRVLYAWIAPPEWLPRQSSKGEDAPHRTKFWTAPLALSKQVQVGAEFVFVGLITIALGVSTQVNLGGLNRWIWLGQVPLAMLAVVWTIRWSRMFRR